MNKNNNDSGNATIADSIRNSELNDALGTWMPIETAPKDGTPVLILFKASMHVEDATIHTTEVGDWYYTLFDGECLNDHPTHWHPMIKLPV